MRVKDAVGRFGEDVAVQALQDAGLVVLERNWRSPLRDLPGELDVVAREGRVLVVCEVKTRSGSGFGSPLEAVTPAKQRQVRRLASAWLAPRAERSESIRFDAVRFDAVRFDVVGVLRARDGVRIEHVRGAF